MSRIYIKDNKKLVLKKVINRELLEIDVQDLDIEINKFYSKLKMLKASIFGPLIIRNKGTNLNEEGMLKASYDLYIQAYDYKQYKTEFNVLDEVVVEHCLYTRFEGRPEYVHLAFNKLQIYEYEEDIITKGDIYMISIEDSENHIVMDIFKPVKMI